MPKLNVINQYTGFDAYGGKGGSWRWKQLRRCNSPVGQWQFGERYGTSSHSLNRRIPNVTYGGVRVAPCKFKHALPEMVAKA